MNNSTAVGWVGVDSKERSARRVSANRGAGECQRGLQAALSQPDFRR